MKVENMTSGRTGRAIPNQFQVIADDGTEYFQSYRTVIAKVSHGVVTLDPQWDCSRTTGKYRNQFLGESKAETEAKIKSGEYTIAKLN